MKIGQSARIAHPLPYGAGTIVPKLDEKQLRESIESADLRVLLMVLFHLTGDLKWLNEPYKPRRDVRLIAQEDAGFSPEIREAIRSAATESLLESAGRAPRVGDPGDGLMTEMMRACMNESIDSAYAPMMREELGFKSRDVTSIALAQSNAQEDATPVLIVGAGASGIILGARLKRLGFNFMIVERAQEVGGTWRDNRYPGCGVDTPNHAYSFSLGGRYEWSTFFSSGAECLDYMRLATQEFDIRSHIRFSTNVETAEWDDNRSLWIVSTSGPNGPGKMEARVLVSAIGQFSMPSIPALPGLNNFKGRLFHTANWPDDLDVAGLRVSVIGTGASAMQIIPTIADIVGQLDIYQRSPQWARPIPRYHEKLTANARWLLAHVPFYAAWFRFAMLWRYGDGLLPFLHKDPTWKHPSRSLNAGNDRHRREMTDHILSELKDRPDLIAKCVPSYPPFGKRILLDNDWYRTLLKPNVALITDRIEKIVEGGVVTAESGNRPADIIIMATGFQITQMATRLNLRGRNGRPLEDVWSDDNATAYLGIAVPHFPNLFLMQGPNTGLGHGGSAICQAEAQARYITSMVARMSERNISSVEVRQDAHDSFVEQVDALHEKLIWTHPGMSTYYRNRHGRVVSVSPFSLLQYWQMTHDADLTAYECRSN